MSLRILVVDDHEVVREGLRLILSGAGLQVAGEAGTGADALDLIRTEAWDVVILDLDLPDRNGLDVLMQIRAERPRLPVLVLSIHPEEKFGPRLLRAGATGYLTKETIREVLVEAVQRVARGRRYISSELAERLAFERLDEIDVPRHELLSNREFEVFLLIAQGRQPREIATQLSLSPKTISAHRANILRKMELGSNADVAAYAVRHELIR